MIDLQDTLVEAIRVISARDPVLARRIGAAAAHGHALAPAAGALLAEWQSDQPTDPQNHDLARVFTKIYAQGLWGRDANDSSAYYSGSGTHTPAIADPYVAAIRALAATFPHAPSAADLGCGDFHIGAQVRGAFASYIACDIVPGLIEQNRQRYNAQEVEFRCLDLTTDDLPQADVIVVRQVLQHLSNRDIAGFVSRVAGKCHWLVVTEHWPAIEPFDANVDIPTGSEIRLAQRSGVVLTQAPFNLRVVQSRRLCAQPEFGGMIVTMAYRMAP